MKRHEFLANLEPEERKRIRDRIAENEKRLMAMAIVFLFVAMDMVIIFFRIESQIATGLVFGTLPLIILIVQHYWRKGQKLEK